MAKDNRILRNILGLFSKSENLAHKHSAFDSYRPEIDGLRALAVIAVIFYHAEFVFNDVNFFIGGFLGVDIFFVISGYLITSIILRDCRAGEFSFAKFYNRRARRLLPTLLTVICICLPLAWFLMLPKAFIEFSKSSLSSLFFSSNIFFWMEDSYTAEPSHLKPLLHTWSLAIEEQFYLIFPICLLAVWKFFRRYIFIAIVTLLIASFGLSFHQSNINPDAAFYLLPTRFWELSIGAVLASHQLTHGRSNLDSRMSFWMPILGLGIILYFMFFATIHGHHPGLLTLPPTIGVALIIWFSGKGDVIGNILSTRLLVGIGKLSYALYLTHFPTFVFLRIFHQGPLTDMQKWLGIVVATLLACAIYFWIENPFRFKVKTRPFYVTILSVLAIIIIFNLTAISKQGFPKRFETDGDDIRSTLIETVLEQRKARQKAIRSHRCYMNTYGKPFSVFTDNFPNCNILYDDRPNILVIGDSEAADLWGALSRNYVDANFLQITGGACGYNQYEPRYPQNPRSKYLCASDWEFIWKSLSGGYCGLDIPTGLSPLDGGGRCSDMWAFGLDYVRDNKDKLSGVIITSRYDFWLKLDFEQLADIQAETNVPVTILGPNLHFTSDPHEFIIRYFKPGAALNQELNQKLPYRFKTEDVDNKKAEMLALGINYIPKIPFLCPEGTCTFFTEDGKSVYYNANHWTTEGGDVFAREMQKQYPTIEGLFDRNTTGQK